jgi:hypothetical protein
MSMNAAEKQALLKKTVDRIRRMANLALHARDYFIELVHRAADVEGVESVFLRINQRDDDAALDHLMEIKYGLLFRDIHFLLRFEPTGSKGPDVMVERDDMSAFVEVKRYRPKEGESIPESFGPHGTLLPYGGNPALAQDRMEKDLLCKVRQVEPRNGVQHGILAVWSDRVSAEDDVFVFAVRRISPQAAQKGLRFCIFGSDYVTTGRRAQRFYCEPVSLPATPFKSWMEDIRGQLG